MSLIVVTLGDHVSLRKPHPCGSLEWKIVRAGADIGLECLKCGRRVMLPREEFERRVRHKRPAGEPSAPGSARERPKEADC